LLEHQQYTEFNRKEYVHYLKHKN